MEYPLEHHDVQTNGIRLHVVQCGPTDGPLVMLLHGFPEFWYGWRYQIPALATAGYRVWAPDQRGYNLSDKPRRIRDYVLPQLAADVVGLIDAAGREKASIVGHDWGGIVAWQLATYHAPCIERAVILNVTHPAVIPHAFLRLPDQLLRSWYVLFFQLPWVPQLLLRLGGARQLLLRTSAPGTFTEEALLHYRAAWLQPRALPSMLNWYRAFRYTLGHQQPKPCVTVPVQILWGKRDVFLNAKLAELSLALCEQGQLHYFPGTTHWIQLEQAAAVNQRLLDFFAAGQPSQAAPRVR